MAIKFTYEPNVDLTGHFIKRD